MINSNVDPFFYQSILNGLADPIMVIQDDYRILMMNQAAYSLWRPSGCDDEPIYCFQVSHGADTPCKENNQPCPLEKVRESGTTVTVTHEHIYRRGGRRIIEVVASPLRDTEGKFSGIIESMHDITDCKRAEEALKRNAQRLRALSTKLTEIEDAERQRIARDLHDQIGQNLTAIGLNLNLISGQLPEGTPDALHYRVQDSLSLVDQTTERIRDLMADLRPPVLDDYGLFAALCWYSEQFARRTGLLMHLEGEALQPRLNAQTENALYWIAQEALVNTAKYAKATQVWLEISDDRDEIRLAIKDDGIGFDRSEFNEPKGTHGWGLLTMSERAEAVGGNCQIKSSPSSGTEILVKVPR